MGLSGGAASIFIMIGDDASSVEKIAYRRYADLFPRMKKSCKQPNHLSANNGNKNDRLSRGKIVFSHHAGFLSNTISSPLLGCVNAIRAACRWSRFARRP